MVITARKAAHLKRDESRKKRRGSATVGELTAEGVMDELLSREPSPELAAEVADEYRRLLAMLKDKELEAVALAKMEGCTVEEIGQRLGYAPRSIKRKLQMIRGIWEKEMTP
jgi:DNA-directed RNA polymerase specialized sigma24 family protein